MPATRMSDGSHLVLVTNDDGIESVGLLAMVQAVLDMGARVLVAAPAENMSGASAAIGPIGHSVKITHHQLAGCTAYAVQAPPSMIVVAAANGGLGERPTCVASGVNAGANLGRAILHSGTVGAALTAQNLGLPAVAVSLESGTEWAAAAEVGARVLDGLLEAPRPLIANVNAPTAVSATTPLRRTTLSRFGSVSSAIEGEELQFQLVIDPRRLDEEGTDAGALSHGDVSVTMLSGVGGHATFDTDFDLTRPTVHS